MTQRAPSLWVSAVPWLEGYYATLARIDLRGEDAANLHDPRRDRASTNLKRAYSALEVSAQHALQVLALRCAEAPDLSELKLELERFERGLSAAQTVTQALWVASSQGAASDFVARRRPLAARHGEVLLVLLEALYAHNPERAPERVIIYPVKALASGSSWTHGRATAYRGEHRVALDWERDNLAAPLQLLHELTHFVTDPLASQGHLKETRSTRLGEPGRALHERLERWVVEVDAALIAARAPERWHKAFESWRQRYGM